jgi:putative ABC transport system permease protein
MDQFFGATGGPNGSYYSPGDSFTLTDPRTGLREQKIIAGILINAQIFYPVNGQSGAAYPVIGSAEAVRSTFGKAAELTGALIRTRPGVDPQRLASELQSAYLSSSLVATPMAASVRRMFAANVAFFRLMQGFLALGLAVGITGLGVVMVRAVRERRRTIGVLRALGFASRTVQRSFLMESAIVAAEGVVLGSVLGLLTTWLMYDGVRVRFPIEWPIVSVLVAVTVALSLAATWLPARNAARIRPAVAVRIAD